MVLDLNPGTEEAIRPDSLRAYATLHSLGFETIWLSPFFTSPQQDHGYDVSDYLDVAPEYGLPCF